MSTRDGGACQAQIVKHKCSPGISILPGWITGQAVAIRLLTYGMDFFAKNGNISIGLSLIQDVQIPGFTIYLPQSKKTKSSLSRTLNGSQGLPKFACCSMFLLGGLALWLIPLQIPIAKSTRRVKTYHPSCVYLRYPFPSKETMVSSSVHESESDFVKMNKFYEFLSP